MHRAWSRKNWMGEGWASSCRAPRAGETPKESCWVTELLGAGLPVDFNAEFQTSLVREKEEKEGRGGGGQVRHKVEEEKGMEK